MNFLSNLLGGSKPEPEFKPHPEGNSAPPRARVSHLRDLTGGERAMEHILETERLLGEHPATDPAITLHRKVGCIWKVLVALAHGEPPYSPPPPRAPFRSIEHPWVWDDAACQFPTWELVKTPRDGAFCLEREWKLTSAKLPAEVETPLREWLGVDYQAVNIRVKPTEVQVSRVLVRRDGSPNFKKQGPREPPNWNEDLDLNVFPRKPASGKPQQQRESA